MYKFFSLFVTAVIIVSCTDGRTYVPDNEFEEFLICKGYDDVMDDYVLTSSIDTITIMRLPYDFGNDCGHIMDVGRFTGIQDFIALREFSAGTGDQTSLDLSSLINLEKLSIRRGEFLDSLNISGCINLESLSIGYPGEPNLLKSLDLTRNINLSKINLLSLRDLATIDLSLNINLVEVMFEDCPQIDSVNLSNAPLLAEVEFVTLGNLNKINLKNGNNIHLTRVNLFDLKSPAPTCIEVDDITYASSHWTLSDGTAIFSDNCP